MKPLPDVWAEEWSVSGTQLLQVPCGLGAKNGDMVNICELLINVVSSNKRKATDTYAWTKRVRGMDRVFYCHPAQSMIPTGGKAEPKSSCWAKGLWKPRIVSTVKWKASSNVSPWASRGSDVGRSECHPVMGWIRVQDLPGSERKQTSDGCRITGEILEKIKS
jgi:hypothetical protein